MSGRKAKFARVVASEMVARNESDAAFRATRKGLWLRILAAISPRLRRRLDAKARAAFDERNERIHRQADRFAISHYRGKPSASMRYIQKGRAVARVIARVRDQVRSKA
jgi:hypothetical protein